MNKMGTILTAAAILILTGSADPVYAENAVTHPEVVSSEKEIALNQSNSLSSESHQKKKEMTDKTAHYIKETLKDINAKKLGNDDFTIEGISLGDSVQKALTEWGIPAVHEKGTVREVFSWKDISVQKYAPLLVKYNDRKDLPADFNIPATGIFEIKLTGEGKSTARGIRVGSSRENLLRLYGRADQILWDGNKDRFFFQYGLNNKKIIFTVQNDRVTSIQMIIHDSVGIKEEKSYLNIQNLYFLEDRDFQIAGFKIGDVFRPYSFDEWEKKARSPKEEVTYYSGYAIRATSSKHLISAMFLTDTRMLMSRGLTLGDQVSTVDLLYGKPHRIELDASGVQPKMSYVYFSKGKNNVLIISLINNKVDGIISLINPVR